MGIIEVEIEMAIIETVILDMVIIGTGAIEMVVDMVIKVVIVNVKLENTEKKAKVIWIKLILVVVEIEEIDIIQVIINMDTEKAVVVAEVNVIEIIMNTTVP